MHSQTSPAGTAALSRERSLARRRQISAFWFLAPMLVMLFCVAAWPLLRSIYFSFTDTTLSNLYGGPLDRLRQLPFDAQTFVGSHHLAWRAG